MKNRTYVVGHVNPDTDSIASAVGYAWLLHERDNTETIAARAGSPNQQTIMGIKSSRDGSPGVIDRRFSTL